jgi:hypothetical protein
MAAKPTESQFFDFVITVKITEDITGTLQPSLHFRFPPLPKETANADSKFIDSVIWFCYPDLATIQKNSKKEEESNDNNNGNNNEGYKQFSFVLTEVNGSRRFGYCRRFCLPMVNSNQVIFSFLFSHYSFLNF